MAGIDFSKMPWSLIRDPVYNYIDYNKVVEKPVIDSAAVQRLRWLRQLQLANMVYPGADHSRFQHSIGVMHLAGLFAQTLVREYFNINGNPGYSFDDLVEIARIAGLLHDVGHGPFSHAFEEAIYWQKKLPIEDHEEAGYYLVKYSEVADILEKHGILDPVLQILSNKKPNEESITLIRKTVKEWIYPADVMDFLMRDSYYTGTREYGVVDYERLIKLSHVDPGDPSSICLEEKALGALSGYLRSRIAMFENVYIHPVSAIFSYTAVLMLQLDDELTNYYSEAIEALSQGDPSKYLRLTDYSALEHALQVARETGNDRLRMLAESIYGRRLLWKLLYELKTTIEPRQLTSLATSILLKKSRDLVNEIESSLKDRLEDTILSEYKEEFWVSINTLKPTPPVPTGIIQLCSMQEGRVASSSSLTIADFLEREGIKLKLIVRIYAPREIIGDQEKYRVAEKVAYETLVEYIRPTGLFTGITM
mgnify:CR=1 FL=1